MHNDTTKIIAEIGINHNGSIDICKKLINIASAAGCDYVKIQKRTPDLCVPENKKIKYDLPFSGSKHFYNKNRKSNLSFLYNSWKKFKVFIEQNYKDIQINIINPIGLKGYFNDVYQ